MIPVFSWEAYEKGSEVHVQADPTKLELLDREYQKKKETYKDGLKSNILERYGGQEHLDAPPKQLLLAQTVSTSSHASLSSFISITSTSSTLLPLLVTPHLHTPPHGSGRSQTLKFKLILLHQYHIKIKDIWKTK